MTKRLLIAVALSGLSFGALADDTFPLEAQRRVELKDGQMLYVFRDGKTAVEDRYGWPAPVRRGTTVETKDGEKIVITSNEVSRLHQQNPSD